MSDFWASTVSDEAGTISLDELNRLYRKAQRAMNENTDPHFIVHPEFYKRWKESHE